MKILLFFLMLGAAAHAGISAKIVEAARKQIGVTLSHDPAYAAMTYPGGDVSKAVFLPGDLVTAQRLRISRTS